MTQLIDREATRKVLKARQNAIRYESEDDEGAAEFWGELQSVIDAITPYAIDDEILQAANYVGESGSLVWSGR